VIFIHNIYKYPVYWANSWCMAPDCQLTPWLYHCEIILKASGHRIFLQQHRSLYTFSLPRNLFLLCKPKLLHHIQASFLT